MVDTTVSGRMNGTSSIRINLSAVEYNMRILRRIVGPHCAICPIVKADAYGLGAPAVARHLEAAGADMLAVYTPAQAAELARAAVGSPILVLMPVRDLVRVDEAYRLLIRDRLHLTVHDLGHLEDLKRLAERFATVIPLHLEVDTGMGRGGCAAGEAPAIAEQIDANRRLRLAGVGTHFAKAGSDARFTNRQLATFDQVVKRCAKLMSADCLVHTANTFATLRGKRYHKSMVRVGQAWAGLGGETITGGEFRKESSGLRGVVTWTSRIVAVKTIARGSTVGYGANWTAKRRSRIGIVSAGYADGYPRGVASLDDSPKPACVGIELDGGMRFARVVGQVNMDQITIDLTEIAPPAEEVCRVGPGTTVELIGPDPEAPDHPVQLARAAGTVPHEILCRMNPRIERVYEAKETYDGSLEAEAAVTPNKS